MTDFYKLKYFLFFFYFLFLVSLQDDLVLVFKKSVFYGKIRIVSVLDFSEKKEGIY